MTETPSLDERSQALLRVLVRATDDSAAVIIGAVLVESMLSDALHAKMPNRSKNIDPLSLEGIPLGIAPMAKWAYALGVIDRTVYDTCRALGKLRNEAAHLISGPTFSLETTPNKDVVNNMFEKMERTPGSFNNFKRVYEFDTDRKISEFRMKFDFVALYLSVHIELSPGRTSSKT